MLSIPHVLHKLRELGIQSLMVEGGATVIRSFLEAASTSPHTQPGSSRAFVDALIITVAPIIVGDRGVAYSLKQVCKRSLSQKIQH
jgi:2,5-diamino-6-(ribosylamino)-4(3H)-pyrimidinone 5'-phosphate reductase